MWNGIQTILILLVFLEVGILIKLLLEYREPKRQPNKVFVRFAGGKEYALTERTVHELQLAGVSLIVEQH